MGALQDLARRLGVVASYTDQTGRERATSDATARALLTAMGLDPSDHLGDDAACAATLAATMAADAARVLPRWLVVDLDLPLVLPALADAGWRLTPERGEAVPGQGALIGPLSLGIHALDSGGQRCWLLAAPASLPEPPRGWGVTLPLYGLATAEAGGIGDYDDLARAVRAAATAGAGFVGVNPIHAGFPTDPASFSPYAPSSRGRFSTLHIAAGAATPPGAPLIDYAAIVRAQGAALEAAYAAWRPEPAFQAWRQMQGPALERFALHQALSDAHGPYWPDWPAKLHDADGDAALDFADRHADRVKFHCWLQWTADRQLAAVRAAGDGMAQGLYLDLAVGVHPAGAETWGAPHLFARGVSLGSPPDGFSADGQKWGLAPLLPAALADEGFRPLADILAAQFRHARMLRIDHILGFERTFWVPDDGAPGGYVVMPREALLAVARIEAARVGGTVVGEDLGNIPDGLDIALHAAGLLGCRVAMFEWTGEDDARAAKPPSAYVRRVLTSFGTHDLPTWEGWRVGRDLKLRHDLGSMDDAAFSRAMRARKVEVAALEALAGGAAPGDIHRLLARTPSLLVAVQIEDALGLGDQPNLPGTVHEHPNWRRRLPVGPDGLAEVLAPVAGLMRDADR